MTRQRMRFEFYPARCWTLCVLVGALGLSGPACCRTDSHLPVGEERSALRLSEVREPTGIDFRHTDGSSGQRYIVETITAGLALFDYNQDGRTDIYFLNGAPLSGWQGRQHPRNALYRNEGDWKFTDVTDAAGVGEAGFGLGVAVGDFNHDGALDLFVNNYGPNVLYTNNGDGTFTDATSTSSLSAGDKVGAGACFLDADGDGNLDLYVGNYVDFRYDNHVVHQVDGFASYAGPRDYRAVPDELYHNEGDGTFTDVSLSSGIGNHAGTSMGMVAADCDRDGDADLLVLNDVAGNFLFQNDGTGRFTENGLLTGFAYNGYGDELGSMGVDCGDYDNDGWLDLFMTSYQGEMPVLYRNVAGGVFEDVTLAAGAAEGSLPYVNWGTALVDLDNDGDRDLFIGQGHLQDNIDAYDRATAYRVRNSLLENLGDGTFVDVSDLAGDGLQPAHSSRGVAFDDLDADGRLDAVILNSRERPTILCNASPADHHWLCVRLIGTRTNRSGIGARVTVTAGDLVQVDEVHSGRGYQSHFGLCLHFGLGTADRADKIEVRWNGGGVDVLEDVGVDRELWITEGVSEVGEARP